MKTIITTTPDQTMALGQKLGAALALEQIFFSIALAGDLGAGKTCFVQGLARGLGVDQRYYITSPTFNIINEYPAAGRRLLHLDLYRLGESDELAYLGLEELQKDDTVAAVEWPGLLEETGFKFNLHLKFQFDADFNRIISFLPSSQLHTDLLDGLFSKS
ncbi:MAG: tRNA (adenosine(37)-N6)-threonylcarbamoyltransferase complex ATPase subunit type 1 TsaE [Desulfobacterales bacterium]|nr:MAG: tRNA (adenosine(37)-N6)-threonylcarbamoyltransferase complex ATPase subunit type 1 TsaE [Desulfobacterales bacterium]